MVSSIAAVVISNPPSPSDRDAESGGGEYWLCFAGHAMREKAPMNVKGLEILRCDAGWRNYHFLKLTTDEGVVGWSEFDEGFGSPGVSAVIERLAGRVVGQPVSDHERIHTELYCFTRPAAGGVVAEGLGAIENALLDAKAKAIGVPCHALLGGKLRDRIRVYWSHCATWRINHPTLYKPAITSLDGVKAIGAEVRDKGFGALKTNIFIYDGGAPRAWRPGFGVPFMPELNVDKSILRNLRAHLEAIRDGAGPNVDLLLDLNFNAKTEGYLKILRAIADIEMFWVEIDSYSPAALAYIRRQSPHPISSCETLLGLREFLPYFREQSMDVAIVDAVWNGVWQSMKIAAAADAHEVNIAPHNFYGHLATMMNAHFAAATPNLRIMEVDIDRLPWDAELFTKAPQFEDGQLIVPDEPGWGTEPDEDGIRAHEPRAGGGLLDYRQPQKR
jgi:galactonate dehydratase